MNRLTRLAADKLRDYIGLPRSIYVLFISRVVNALGNFVYPFLTLFLTQKIGYSATEASDYFMYSFVFNAVGTMIGGKLADHLGRKRLMMVFQLLAALSFGACAFVSELIWIPRLLITAGFFASAAQPANSAMVTDLTDRHNRKFAMSLLYLGINIGFTVGPTLAGLLYNYRTEWIFLGNALANLLTIFLLLFFVKETIPTAEQIEASKAKSDDEGAESKWLLIALARRPILLLFMLARFAYSFVYASIGFAIPLQINNTFGGELGPSYFGYVMSFTGFVVIAFTLPSIKLTSGNKPIINEALAGLFYAIGFGMLAFVNNLAWYFVAGFIFTVGEILDVTNSGVFIANHSPINHRARFNAVLPLFMGSGHTLGIIAFGRIIDAYGLKSLWHICFIMAAIAAVYMLWLNMFEIRYKCKREGMAA
ncbi:MAG: MFS transporter [Bacillota bacterium]